MDNKIGALASKKLTLVGYICALLVVLIHSSGYKYFHIDEGSIGSTFIVNLIDILTIDLPKASVSVFFMMSGFLFFNGVANITKGTIKSFFREKYIKRIKTLLIPYLLWNVIWLLFTIFVTYTPVISNNIESLPLFEPNITSILKGVFLFEYSGICWYIFYLMIYALLSPLIYYGMKRKSTGVVLLIFTYIICGIIHDNEWINY